MRIGILGQPCIDEIISNDRVGSAYRGGAISLGGVLYSFAAMDRLMSDLAPNDTFIPLSWYAKPDAAMLDPLLLQFTHMERASGMWPVNIQTNRVQLVYQSSTERLEHCPHILPALTERELTPDLLSTLDGLFVNMISGFDVTIDTLENSLAAARKRPYVHLDIHALILGDLSHATPDDSDYGAGRKPRGVKDWKRWLAIADSVQLNELELRWFAAPEITTEPELIRYIQNSPHKPKYVIITRGAKGATLFNFQKEMIHHAAAPEMKILETTGSGDVFGSAFIFHILHGHTTENSLRESVGWATWNATLQNIAAILTAPLT